MLDPLLTTDCQGEPSDRHWNGTILRRVLSCLVLALLLALWPNRTLPAWHARPMATAAKRIGGAAPAGVQALQRALDSILGADERARLQTINDFFNRRIAFREDRQLWGQIDYWASPVETLGRGAGDCEDYAIAKYFGLIAAGVPSQRLRLVYVRARVEGEKGLVQAHMVLAYYPQSKDEPLILDNLIDEIRPASRRPDLVPVFSFNGEGLWQGVGAQATGDPLARLSRWREVLAKARAEGFQ